MKRCYQRPRWVIAALLVLGLLPVLTGIARMFAMAGGAETANAETAPYIEHAGVSLLHIVPGIVFLLTGPFQFHPRLHRPRSSVHRISGYLFVLSGFSCGLTALWINAVFPAYGGLGKLLANYLFAGLMIYALAAGMRAILTGRVKLHQQWMMRAYAIGLGVGTMRFVMIPLHMIYGDRVVDWAGWALWIGFSFNLGIAEWLIHRGRKHRRVSIKSRTILLGTGETGNDSETT